MVDDLISAMERRKIDTPTQNALLERLAKLYAEVVYQ